MPSVAGVIIGNEILSGKFADENGPHLIARARAVGADLRRLVTIADDRDVIAAEVRACSQSFDHVITSGGVGPTHDDVTLESVAMAFGLPIVRHPELQALLQSYDLTNPHAMRMAEVPQGTSLHRSDPTRFPVLQCRNVWILPGVPKLFRAKLEIVLTHLHGRAVHARRLYTREPESQIAERLERVQRAFPAVEIGSYPRYGEGPAFVIVTLESRDPAAVALAASSLTACLVVFQPPDGPIE